MRSITVQSAQQHLAELISELHSSGESVQITDPAGNSVAELRPLKALNLAPDSRDPFADIRTRVKPVSVQEILEMIREGRER